MKRPKELMRFAIGDTGGEQELTFAISQAVIAGWTGRDAIALEKHIRELQELGVAPPSSTPIFYRVSTSRLVTASVIEVIGDRSSGEVFGLSALSWELRSFLGYAATWYSV